MAVSETAPAGKGLAFGTAQVPTSPAPLWILVAICIVAFVGGFQGRTSLGLTRTIDQVVAIDQADRLLQGKGLPSHGVISSLGSYIPPGTCWLLALGMLTGDFHCFQPTAAAALLVLGTVGVFLLTRELFGPWPAVVAAATYAFSPLGMSLGQSLWPRGRPEFWTWIAYFSTLWMRRGASRYLAAAVFTYFLGMYLHMEMAPAILLPILAWWKSRPPVRWLPLAIALIGGIVVWSPYLAFETQRGGKDLVSQLFLRPIPAPSEMPEPDLANVMSWDPATGQLLPGAAGKPFERTGLRLLGRKVINLVSNVPAVMLWPFITAGPAAVGLGAILLLAGLIYFHRVLLWAACVLESQWRWAAVPICLFVAWLLDGPWIVQKLHLEEPHRVLFIGSRILVLSIAALVALGPWVARGLRWANELAGRFCDVLVETPAQWMVFAGTCLPWFVIPFVSPVAYRLWGLWGLQLCLLVGCLALIGRHLKCPAWARALAAVFVIASVTASMWWERTAAFVTDGFAGRPALSVVAADALAADIKKADLSSAKVGYLIAFDDWEAGFHCVEPAYHIGMQFDAYLQHQHGVTNETQNVFGFDNDDQYRLVQMTIDADHGVVDSSRKKRFIFSDQDSFEQIEDFGGYQIWRRRSTR